ncbi:MAG: YidC/Oxa1 family insertase periplasmic-domain containing protein [Gemmatimonadaceae bacterium]
MDKRLFLALLLTALVVVLTPLVFPTPRPRPQLAPTASDTAATATGGDRRRAPPAASAQTGVHPATGERSAPPTVGAARPASADTTRPPVPAAAAETIIVRGGGSTYRFINPGATPVSVALADYRSLRPGGQGSVDLVRPGDQLLRYRVAFGADTIALDTLPMRASATSAPGGATMLAFASGPLAVGAGGSPARVTLSYTIPPGGDTHLALVEGRVDGIPAGRATLLLDLPRTLRTEEADTLEDLRHLSYAVKRDKEDVRSTGFGNLDTATARVEAGPFAWVAVRNKYFITALTGVGNETPFARVRLAGVPHPQRALPREGRATALVPLGDDGTFRFQVYAGPQKYTRLHALGRDLENVNPYGGWMHGFVQPFSTIVMRILLWLKRTTALNYGWVLVIFGVLVRMLIWPLNQSAMRSSIRMQRLQPQLQEIQKKYRHDPERQREALMKLYQEHGMNPFAPILGCLPMLLPMPVLFALYFVFQNTIEFRGVPFLWLPDLALKDPYYITPLLMGLSMLLLSWIGMKGAPQTPQTKMIGYMMPAMMTVLFWNFPSGLNLYYGVQNLVALPQQWLLTRERVKATGAQAAGSTAPASMPKTPKPAKASGAAKAR